MKLVRCVFRSLCSLLLLGALATPTWAVTLSDSTESSRFQLGNGLQVRARHIPGAKGVAITVAYRAGKLHEPAGREGVADLLAQLEFTSPAGSVPNRSYGEMNSLRPLGWGVRTNSRLALLTEIATHEQFPGVLRQVAERMRGVQVTPAALKTAISDNRRDLGVRFFGAPDLALYYRATELAHGASDEQIIRLASGEGIEKLSVKEVTAMLQRLYVPANAVVAVVGDLSGFDVEKMMTAEFGTIPAGVAAAPPTPPAFRAGQRAMPWKGISQPIGVLALQSLALTDSLHPSFYISSLITGAGLRRPWGAAAPPLTLRFQYSLFDDAEIVRFYPPIAPGMTDPQGMGEEFSFRLGELAVAQMTADVLDAVKSSTAWLLGAPLSPDLRRRAQTETGPLSTLGTSMATRALWQGDEFWDDYLVRFLTQRYDHTTFFPQMDEPSHQFKLLFAPAP